MADENNDQTNTAPTKELSLWKVYGICLLISTIFFFLFGFNSPIYKFNSDPDYNIHVTMGNALIHGKVPYRDLFDHKGPLVYFLYGFCCLFPTPRLAMLLIEIFCMSLFFFFAFRIARKFLNTFCSLLIIPILAFIVFPSWNRVTNASCIEEFCLPMLTYFLYCWIEFILEKKQWTWTRSLIIGICIGIIFWSKFTILSFMIVPMIIWAIKNIYNRQYYIFYNILFIAIGLIIISMPIILFYGLQNALGVLFKVYLGTNITGYGINTNRNVIEYFKSFFDYNPFVIFLISYGLTRFVLMHCNSNKKPIVFSFLSTFIMLIFTAHHNNYYFNTLIPYTIFGVIIILEFFNSKIDLTKKLLKKYFLLLFCCILACLPISILPLELNRNQDEYKALEIAKVIKEELPKSNITIFCYEIPDLGIYSALNIMPNNYFFVKNNFSEIQLPEMYKSFENSIRTQTSDFIITTVLNWEKEKNFISQYYKPLTGYIKSSSFEYLKLHYFYYLHYHLIILKKI